MTKMEILSKRAEITNKFLREFLLSIDILPVGIYKLYELSYMKEYKNLIFHTINFMKYMLKDDLSLSWVSSRESFSDNEVALINTIKILYENYNCDFSISDDIYFHKGQAPKYKKFNLKRIVEEEK